MKKTFFKTALKILIILSPVILFVLAYFGAKFFDAHDSQPTCFTLRLFGFYCPACGMTRSVIALMNGDILLSIRQNAMVIVFILLYVVFYIWYILKLFNVKFYLFLQNEWFWYILITVWFIYGISRNFIPLIAPI